MTITPGDELNRNASGRFVRNLALSLSGGALLTLLGASAAHADDLADAGSTSDGTGQANSGDANAIGNQSGTNTTQTVTVSGNLGTIQVINQQANVSNIGAGVANTGGNIAIGNGSVNIANGEQTGQSGLGPATNTGTAANSSDGTAAIGTGNATAIGNQSSTTINQTAHGSAHGLLGGILVINQDANVLNSGVALANTGGNRARGNDSENGAGLLQDAVTSGGIAANSGTARNESDGRGTINTGNAAATGNKSDTQIIQSATGSAGGALGGLVIIDQDAFVANVGAAAANTGGNRATGNDSDNGDEGGAGVEQTMEHQFDPTLADEIGVASNNGEASNHSDGSADVRTGDATAIGNDSKTTVKQYADSDIEGPGGGAIVSQTSNVLNLGLAAANTGLNRATGNDSENGAFVGQNTPPADVGEEIDVVGQFAMASNTSDGDADVHTGKAWANGNQSQTDVTQAATAEGGAFNLMPQINGVQNLGTSVANSGLNLVRGNDSENGASVTQTAALLGDADGAEVIGNFGLASNSSDGSATVTTGDAVATGNRSQTNVGQGIDPTGLIVATQVANVTNAGVGIANTGLNRARGNDSESYAEIEDQSADIGEDNQYDWSIEADTIVASNNGEASNSSDGTAIVRTGNASGVGNDSITSIGQTSTGDIDGGGLILHTQAAAVANTGLGIANTGLNDAVGNTSDNTAIVEDQTAEIGSDNVSFEEGASVEGVVITAANNGTASNTSDGTAKIATGNASGVGNRSTTNVRQDETGEIAGLGGVINTQVAVVGNVGVGVGNSGLNRAVGNASTSGAELNQKASIASDNFGEGEASDELSLIGTFITASNSGEASNTSDGTANVTTGTAVGTGNSSATDVSQATGGDVSGLGLVFGTQVAGVANVGLGVANTGANLAVGNVSDNTDDGPGAELGQEALILSGNFPNEPAPADLSLLAFGPVTASNSGEATNSSDGTADVTTGGAQGQGNVSATQVVQDPDSKVDGSGLIFGTQVAGVANVGVGVANSGLNAGIGNASGQVRGPNHASTDQAAEVASNNDSDGIDLTIFGPVTASNQGTASNSSDGHAKVKTGGALATGNASATNVRQAQSASVTDGGLVIGTQLGGVANVGVGVANTGANAVIGNASANDAHLGDEAPQSALIISENDAPVTPLTVLGPVTASNSGEASNTSDGEACACTGDAVASGNVSSTTLVQDLDLSTEGGFVLVTEVGGVLNAGLGLANSGLNLAVGNVSDNTALLDQEATINDALPIDGIVGPQTAPNQGTADNHSGGKGLVASGNAVGTGNQSTTNFTQAADVDSDFALSTISGGTTNAGLGLANTGLNVGIGNASTNVSDLDQSADGSGLVGNTGEATNDSDGTATIGDPTKCDDDVTKPPAKPPVTQLPRTGGPLEAEAAFGLMLVLMGFGLRRRARRLG